MYNLCYNTTRPGVCEQFRHSERTNGGLRCYRSSNKQRIDPIIMMILEAIYKTEYSIFSAPTTWSAGARLRARTQASEYVSGFDSFVATRQLMKKAEYLGYQTTEAQG